MKEFNYSGSTLVMLSGGVGSAVLVASLKNSERLEAVFFDYLECSTSEFESAKKIADYYNVKLHIIDIRRIYESLSLTQATSKFRSFDNFYIPYRNGTFISLAVALAYSEGFDNVVWGISSNSSAYHSDCSVSFVEYQKGSIVSGTYGCVRLITPFLYMEKWQVFKLGVDLGVPLGVTWSCINSGKECGICFGCMERAKSERTVLSV